MVSAKPLTAQQEAELLTVSPRTIYRLIDSGELAGKKVGNKYRTTDAACIAYLNDPRDLVVAARVSVKEIIYVNHPQRRRVALSFRYTVREKS
ncbi:helix-turn-helix domain-containing protein [Lelliottia nimipressuralis]|uniref:helix-turn-helix domain-containing protein n=1 Tax=Lelliottia nimipressuralis TaxID=69220 RepID=UPI003D2A35DC